MGKEAESRVESRKSKASGSILLRRIVAAMDADGVAIGIGDDGHAANRAGKRLDGKLHAGGPHLRDRDVEVSPGEFIIVPKGVEHLPVADEEVHVVLFEPKTTLNTGNVQNERTLPRLERL